jgi:zinc resistance-associated protein
MLKPLVVATAALAIAGSSFVYAQQRFDGHHGFRDGPRAEHRHHRSAEDVSAFADARIAALKAGLELTADQAKNWPSFEQALRDMAALRVQRTQAREAAANQPQATPFDRLERRADNMAKTSAALKKVADAGAPLYQSLTDAQKGRFTALARMLRPHHHGGGANDGGGWREQRRGESHDGWQGRRFGQNGPAQDGADGRGHDRHGMMNRLSSQNSDDL